MAKDITKEMSLKNKIGQLFMVSVYQLDEAESKNQTSVTSQMKKTLKRYPAGGVIMFAKNINTPDQTKKMTDELQDIIVVSSAIIIKLFVVYFAVFQKRLWADVDAERFGTCLNRY